MDRDLRSTPVYRDVEAFAQAILGPGFGKVTDVRDLEVSPDGRWVAFCGEVLDGLEGRPHGRICLAAADGSSWRTITNGPNDDAEPRWSPDARTLTFRSDRAAAGRFALYALETDGIGEARPLPAVPGVVEHHRWSPDGARILLVVAGEHAEQADALGSGTLGADDAGGPAWLPDVDSSDAKDDWRSLWVLDVPTGEVRRASRQGLNVWEATWLGDAAAVAVVSEAPGEGAWYRAPLAVVDLTDGRERVVRTSDVQLGFAEGSPDGRSIAVIEALCSDRYVVAGDLLLVDPGSGEARAVTTEADITRARWRGDDRLLAAGLDGMDGVTYGVDATTGVATELWRSAEGIGGYGPDAAPFGDAGFATTRSSAERPPSVLLVAAGTERVLVDMRHAGDDEALRHLGGRRRLRWTAPDGLEIEGLLTTPMGDGPFPLVLLVHGGPVGATFDRWPGLFAFLLLSRGYALLEPNPRGSSGRGRTFAARVVGDMGGADSLDLLTGVDAAVVAGVADPERIGVMGGSYGGFMAAWLPTVDDRFKAAVSISPVTDWYSEHFNSSLTDWVGDFLASAPEAPGSEHHARSPVFAGERLRTPTLLTAGLRDRATPPGQAIEMYRALVGRGVPAEVAIYPQEGHGVESFPAALDLLTRTVVWFERFMPARVVR